MYDSIQFCGHGALRPVPGGHRMARSQQVTRHAPTNRAEADEGDFAHLLSFRVGPEWKCINAFEPPATIG
jgi:hypothetical protein